MDKEASDESFEQYIPSRNEIIQKCFSIANSLSTNPSHPRHTDTQGGTQQLDKKSLTLCRSSNMKPGWVYDESDVLNYYKNTLPPSVRPDPHTLARRSAERKRHNSKMREITPITQTRLPKLYYIPWPPQTHKLEITAEQYYRFPESSAATLKDYMSRLQSDDSIELGLRIIIHLNRDTTPLTILPSTKVWHVLERNKTEKLNPESPNLQLIANDLRRKTCPHIGFNLGLTPGFLSMMVYGFHWYTVLLIGADKLIERLQNVLVSVSEDVEEGTQTSQHVLMGMYSKAISSVEFPDTALVIMDSIGITLDQIGWELLENYLFICILQSLGIIIHTAGCDSRLGKLYKLSSEEQEFHLVCASIQAVKQIIWPSRVQIAGPKQHDNRTCGAYGLATTWKLSTQQGYRMLSTFLSDRQPEQGPPKRRRTAGRKTATNVGRVRTSSMRNFQDFYDDNHMHSVMKRFDIFIRKELIKNPTAEMAEITCIE